MKRRWIAAAGLLSLTVLTGCATIATPYAEVIGERTARADPNEEDVLIMAVDSNMTSGGLAGMMTGPRMSGPGPRQPDRIDRPSMQSRVILEPGARLLHLTSVRTRRTNDRETVTVPLNAKPCMRYYFAARHESPTEVKPWRVALKNVEPIGECLAKFPDVKLPPVPAAPAAPSSN